MGNFHAHNTSRGTVNTKIATKKIPKVFVFPLKILLLVTVYKALDGGLEAENTK
jgi:hypothetical protein